MKRIASYLAFAFVLNLCSVGILVNYNMVALKRSWIALSYVDSLCVTGFVLMIALIWKFSSWFDDDDEPDFEIYHICHFCGKSDCKLGKKATEKGLSVMDCPDWEEPHDSKAQEA